MLNLKWSMQTEPRLPCIQICHSAWEYVLYVYLNVRRRNSELHASDRAYPSTNRYTVNKIQTFFVRNLVDLLRSPTFEHQDFFIIFSFKLYLPHLYLLNLPVTTIKISNNIARITTFVRNMKKKKKNKKLP